MGSERTRPIGPPGRRLLVLGAGPVGLEAALYALSLGYDARVVEAGRVGEQVLEWGHVRMFSPWAMNCSPPGLGILAARGLAPYGDGSVCPTGRELVERYLVPLAGQAPLRGRIARSTRVVAVGRDGLLKGDLAGSSERGRSPFRILVVRDGREAILHADLVIDATGTYVRHRFLGDGGIPAPGEIEAAERIDYRLVDLEGPRGSDFAGRRVLLVGAGHSAATSAAGLASLVEKDPRTRVLWAYRATRDPLYPRRPADPLPSRDRLAALANRLARKAIGAIETLPGTVVEAIAPARRSAAGRAEPLAVTLRSGSRPLRVAVDRIIANVGYAPDRSIHAELQVHECYATEGPIKLAAALLGEGGGGGDCLAQAAPSADLLANPEPGFYILGSKSYGRNSAFLLGAGRDQIRVLFAALERDATLDLYSGRLAARRPQAARSPAAAPGPNRVPA